MGKFNFIISFRNKSIYEFMSSILCKKFREKKIKKIRADRVFRNEFSVAISSSVLAEAGATSSGDDHLASSNGRSRTQSRVWSRLQPRSHAPQYPTLSIRSRDWRMVRW